MTRWQNTLGIAGTFAMALGISWLIAVKLGLGWDRALLIEILWLTTMNRWYQDDKGASR